MTPHFCLVQADDRRFAQVWRERVTALNPGCSFEQIQMLTASETQHVHHLVLGTNDSHQVVAVAYLVSQFVNLGLGWRVNVLVLGGSLPGESMWLDLNADSYESYMRQLLQFCSEHIGYSLILVKPFDGLRDAELLRCNERTLKFVNVFGAPRADIDLSGVATYDEYLGKLEKKRRYFLRQLDKKRPAALDVSLTSDFSTLVPEIYALYLNVANRASEVRDLELFPLSYFQELSRSRSGRIRMILAREQGRLIGFMVLEEEGAVVSCGACGLDHAVVKAYNLWFVLMAAAIKYGIQSGKRSLLMGTTNFALKKKFGPTRHDLWLSIKCKSRLATMAFGPLLRLWLRLFVFTGPKQAEE
jgi:hypothetical protein